MQLARAHVGTVVYGSGATRRSFRLNGMSLAEGKGGGRCRPVLNTKKRSLMWRRTIMFLGFALLAGMFGFVGITGWVAESAKVLSVIFLALFLESLSREYPDVLSGMETKDDMAQEI